MHSTRRIDLPSLGDLSSVAAEGDPTRLAFAEGAAGESVDWSTFDERSRRAANAFGARVAQGDRVAFFCGASIPHVTLWNGALKAGCVVSNLHVRAAPETVRYCIDTLRPRVLVVDEEYAEFVAEHVHDEVTTDLDAVVTIGSPYEAYEQSADAFVDGHATDEPDVRRQEDDVAAVVWTSGTTGEPKGWCMTGRGFVLRGFKLATALGIHRGTRRLQGLSPSYAAWHTSTLPALLTHSSTVFLREWGPEAYLQVVEERGVTMATLVPSMWREILRHDRFDEYDVSSFERVTAAGERLDRTTFEDLRARVCDRVYNAYAATEAAVAAISSREMDEGRVGCVGLPMPGTRVRIVEPGGSPDDPLPAGEVGEVLVDAPDVPVWAWADTAVTEASFVDGWWRSGDLGYRDEDGYLFLEGRTDFVIQSKAIKVAPGPVEERLTAHPGVAEAAVVGVDDEEYGEMVTAVVRPADPDLTAEALDEWCLEGDTLARHERPRLYRFVDEALPRTATGKLDRTSIAVDRDGA